MSRIIVQYLIPLLVLLPTAVWAARKWYVKCFKYNVRNQLEYNKATATYEKMLFKPKPKKKK